MTLDELFVAQRCLWCGVPHPVGQKKCPVVKAVDCDENGMVKRVEFMTPGDLSSPTIFHNHYKSGAEPPVKVN